MALTWQLFPDAERFGVQGSLSWYIAGLMVGEFLEALIRQDCGVQC